MQLWSSVTGFLTSKNWIRELCNYILLVRTELESSLIGIVTSKNCIVELSNSIVTSKNAIAEPL